MGKQKITKVLASTTMASLLMSSVVPYNVLALTPSHNTIQGKALSQSQSGIDALNTVTAESDIKISPDINAKSTEPVKVIVEFKTTPANLAVGQQVVGGDTVSQKSATDAVAESHRKFKAFVKGLNSPTTNANTVSGLSVNGTEASAANTSKIEITQEFSYAFNGVAMTLPGVEVNKLMDSGLVNRIFADHVVKLDPQELGQTNVQTDEATNNGTELKENYIPLPGIDGLHQDNIKGNGIKVGVLDTGIDYNHPDLTDVYKGYRKQANVNPATIDPNTVKGWDFVDNDADPMETTYDDWVNAGSPVPTSGSYWTYHGTHVSGTIAAQDKNNVEYPAQGVAPGVDLYVYRVLGPYGSGSDSGILGGIDKAVKDGMKVINLSLGAPVNDPLSSLAVAINNATLAGVTCVLSAGNSGPGEKTLGTPGASAFAITVGASDFPMSVATASATVGNESFTNFKLLGKGMNDHVETLVNHTYPVVFVGLGGPDDYKDANGQPIDLHGKIALIQRGSYSLNSKIENAKKAGATAAIMYNNIDGDIDNYLASDIGFIPTFRMTKADGERLKAAAATSSITFTNVGSTVSEGGHLAGFSSRGPVETSYDIKPDVVAPGVSVYSTYPEYVHSPEPGIDYSQAYARISGTSMASPHVAGIAALILQAHPEYTPADVKAALTNSADPLNGKYSVYEVGAGLVDVTEAVRSDVSFKVQDTTTNLNASGAASTVNYEKGSLTFGSSYKEEGGSNAKSRTVKVTNRSASDKTFDISYEFIKPNANVNDGTANQVTLTVPSSVTVATGKSESFNAVINTPGTAQLGRYEGYVNIVNHTNPNEHYRIPFASRMVEKGIGAFEMDLPAASTRKPIIPSDFSYGSGRNLGFKINNPMKYVWAVIYDKNGNALGAASPAPISANTAPVDAFLTITFDPAAYYPFIGDPSKEFTSQFTRASLPEGEYTIKFRATDTTNMYAKTYETSSLFVVDNQLAKLTYKDHAPGVYELTDADFTDEEMSGETYHAFWVHANLTDEGTAKLAPIGFDQTDNSLFYYYNRIDYPAGTFPTEANGDAKFGIEKADIQNGPAVLTLFPRDVAGNAELVNDFHQYAFVKKGTSYMVPTYNKQKVYLNDTVTMTLNLHNVKEMMSGTYNATYWNTVYDLQGVTVAPEFQKWADEHGVTVNVDTPVATADPLYSLKTMINVGAHLSGGENFKGFSGDEMPFLNVTLKVKNDDPTGPASILYGNMVQDDVMTNFSMMQYGQTQPTNITTFNRLNSFQVIPTHNAVQSFVRLQAFNNNFTIDYTTLKAKAYALLSDGSKYPGTIEAKGYVNITGIPMSKDPIKVIIEAPGHLKSVQTITLTAKTPWGDEVGQFGGYIGATSRQPNGPAGDLNQDGVIDVLDVKAIAKKYGVQKAGPAFNPEDINQDGVVNSVEMNYLIGNLNKTNFDATIAPKEMVDGKYATDYFNMLGFFTPVNTLKNPTKSDKTVSLNWLAAVDATSVIIQQSANNGSTWTTATTQNPLAVDSNTAIVTELNANTTYQFRVKVTGGLNGGNSNVVTVKTDEAQITTPPVTPPVAPKAPSIHAIDDNDTAITGTADSNVNIVVKNNDVVLASGKANAEGNYSFEISPQKAGTVLTVRATDAAGTQSEVTSISVLDRTAPNAPTINEIGDKDTTISGTTEANAAIMVKNKDAVIATGKANAEGNYSIEISAQKVGSELTVFATDSAGNQSNGTSTTVIDLTAPKAPKVNAIDDNDTKISGSTEAGATIVVSSNDEEIATGTADSKGLFSIKIKHQKAGTVLTVTATDESGNESAATKIKVLDKTAPKTPVISSVIVKNKNEIQLTGTAEALSTIIVKNGNKVVATVKVSNKGTFTVKLSKVGKGKKNLTLYAVDHAGNKSSEVNRSVTVK